MTTDHLATEALSSASPLEIPIERRDFLVSVVLAAACGAPGASREARAPYPEWTEAVQNAYVRTLPDGTAARYVTLRAGTKTLASGTFGRWRMQRESEETPSTGGELWGDRTEDGTLVVAGGEYTSETVRALSLPATASFTLDTPVRLDPDAPVGAPQALSLRGNASIAGASMRAEVTGSYTIVDRDATAQTPTGPVHGCLRVALEGALPLLFGSTAMRARGELYYSPTLGVVKATLEQPFAGFGAGLERSEGRHDLGDGWASVESVKVLNGSNGIFDLSSGWDADKRVHAKILLELRWVDETQARGASEPVVREQLGTAIGYFSTALVRSSVSFLHPEENGSGFVYWLAYADQAARNEPGDNSTLYQCEVRYDGAGGPLRVSSRIVYKTLEGA